MYIDNHIGECVEIGNGAGITDSGTLNAALFGEGVDAFAAGALIVKGMEEWAGAIHEDAGAAPRFIVDVDLPALAFLELLMLASLAGGFWEEERTAIALGRVAIGVSVAEGGMHAQTDGTQRHAIGVKSGLGVSIEGHGGGAAMKNGRLVDVPRIRGSVSHQVGRELIEGEDGVAIEGRKEVMSFSLKG